MKKNWIVAVLVLVLVQAGSHAVTASAQELKKIALKYADHIPPVAGGNLWAKKNYYSKIKDECAKLGYDLDITYYHSGSLYKSTEMVGACEKGLVDMTICILPYEQARFPLHEVLDFGFMGWDQLSMVKVWAGLVQSVPEFRNEMDKDFFEYMRYVPSPKWIHTAMGPDVRTPADFKGKKIHTAGMGAEMLKSIGAVPIRQNPGDWYTSLDRGLFEGIVVAFDMVGIMKLWEVLDSHIQAYNDNFGFTPVTHVMNRKKLQSLPEEVQRVFIDNFEFASNGITEFEVNNVPGYQAGAKTKGNNFIQLTADDTEKWRQAYKKIHMRWIKEKEKDGYPARKLYDEAVRLADKYNPKTQ